MKLTKAQKKAKKNLRNKINETEDWQECFKLYKKFVRKYGSRIRYVEKEMEKQGEKIPKSPKKGKPKKKDDDGENEPVRKVGKEMPPVVQEIIERLEDGIVSVNKAITRLEKQRKVYESMIARFKKPYGLK